MGLIHAGMARHGEAIFALAQPEGKGQWGKKWSSEPGSNILLSVIIKSERLKLADQFYFSAAISLAVFGFFKKYAGDETKIKWPNDLYWRDRKAGGILIESVVRSLPTGQVGSESEVNSSESAAGIWEWAVVGVGININQTVFPGELINPVSLKQITGKSFDPVELAKELCICINEQFDLLVSGEKENIHKRYNQHLYKLNEQVKLKKDSRAFDVIIKGVSLFGKLMTAHAFDEEFGFGEVEWVI
jgi:BirA family transcriptional regulator, biotin operon repressor / biotin---[acetyl-CoA-carboxylase] ligase